MKIPSDKQIEFVDSIAKELDIDFPTSSKDFTAKTYWQFVNKYRYDFDGIACAHP